ncbi:MAG: hypothetical protein VX278_01720 [Myxococcota bacterium]|nr:hypothetical protein [Myxococcota bacterium]
MDRICGMQVKGTYKGPASLLADVVDDDGKHKIALVFKEEYHDHPLLNDSIRGILPFLESPYIPGLADLIRHEEGKGTFVFNTGKCMSIAEMVRKMSDVGIQPGPRAGLELIEKASRILVEASDYTIQSYAVGSHGSLTPWRMLVRRNGSVLIIGYAIPQIEIKDFHRDETLVPREDSFRYCPPERISNSPEDVSSDLFALSLIAFEMMTTRPVYDGSVDEIRQKAVRGEAARQLYYYQDVIPKPVRDFLGRALKPKRNNRFPSAAAFRAELDALMRRPDIGGMSLNEVIYKMETMPKQVYESMPEMADTSTTIFGAESVMKKYGIESTDEPIRQEFTLPSSDKPKNGNTPLWGAVRRSNKNAKPSESSAEEALSEPTGSEQPNVPQSDSAGAKKASKKKASNLLNLLRQSKKGGKSQAPNVSKEPKNQKGRVNDLLGVLNKNNKTTKKEEKKELSSLLDSLDTQIKKDPGKSNPLFSNVSRQREPQTSPPPLSQETGLESEAIIPSEPVPSPQSKEREFVMDTAGEPPIPDGGLSENPFLGPVLSFPIFHAQNNLEVFSLSIGEGENIRFRASKDASSANILGTMLIGKRLPIRLDMMGRVSSWYRFQGDGDFLSGHTPMSDLPTGTLHLHMVPNDTKWVQIDVPSKNIKLVTSVGVALPMLSIIDHLVCWLKLPRAQWKVSVNGQEADYYDILVDFPMQALNTIQLHG